MTRRSCPAYRGRWRDEDDEQRPVWRWRCYLGWRWVRTARTVGGLL